MTEKILQRTIESDMKESYLDYAMSVIIGRAIPDIRDGLKPVHRRILYAMHDLGNVHGKPFKKSARVVGECFVKDTLVLTKRGLVPIQKVKRGEKVYTQRGVQKVTELYEMPKQKLLEIGLENGIRNIVTPGQKFKVLNDRLEFEWKEAKELTTEDFLIIKAYYPEIKEKVKLGKFGGKEIHLDENLAYLIGLWVAEGWLDNYGRNGCKRFCVYSTDRKTIEKIARILKKEFDYEATINEKKYEIESMKGTKIKNTGYQVRINRAAINDFLVSSFSLRNKKAATKIIPPQFLASPKSVIYSFVSGLVDGDGSIHTKRNVIHFGSVSEKLVNQLSIILQQLGVFSHRYKCIGGGGRVNGRVVEGKMPLHSLEIRSVCAHRLASHLSLVNRKKAENTGKMLLRPTGESRFDELPHGSEVIFKELSRNHLGAGWYQDVEGRKFRMGIKYPGGCKIRYSTDLKGKPLRKSQIVSWGIEEKLARIGSPFASFVEEMRRENIFFGKVTEIRDAPAQKTYDIQVEKEHEFVANGVISHNCLGKYHPHGDMAIYDALVRMAQGFSLRYTLVDGQGNIGSIDGDNPAAMRYTEMRMSKLASELLADIDKETVSFSPNFDGTLKEPDVMPSKVPNLLINGSSGIAVGMATNVPPHNLNEVIDGTIAVIDGAGEDELLDTIKGPDFPTGGAIVGKGGILLAYKTGRGIIKVRGRTRRDDKRHAIIIEEIPYQLTKSAIIGSIVNAVKSKKIDGISGVHDRSDKEGMEIVLDIKRGHDPDVVLNQLYAHTSLQSTFGIINLAISGKQPKLLSLHSMVTEFIEFRKEIVSKRCQFELKEAEARAHILEGLRKALENIDPIVAFLKASKDIAAARAGLMQNYTFTEIQANAILEMRLSRLIALEREKIEEEYQELVKKIAWLKEVLADVGKILGIIKEELKEIKEKYGDKRRTDILDVEGDLDIEELIPNDEVVVVVTNRGYVKRVGLDEYRSQHRGGKGVIGTGTKEGDFVQDVIVTRNHNYLMLFTDKGRVFWMKVYKAPEGTRYSTGKTLVSLLELKDEKVTSWVSVDKFDAGEYLMMFTKNGIVKRTALSNFKNVRRGGIIAITLKEGDTLEEVRKTDGKQQVIIATRKGQAIKFKEEDAREIGRTGQGVIGIRLKSKDDRVIGSAVCRKPALLTITENGFGKRTSIDEYRLQARGGSGVINIKTEGRNGDVVSIRAVEESDGIILMSSKGQAIRTYVKDISVIGRNTQGVRIIRLGEGEKVATFAVVPKEEKIEEAPAS